MYYDSAVAAREAIRADFARAFLLPGDAASSSMGSSPWDSSTGTGSADASKASGVHCILAPTVRSPVLTMASALQAASSSPEELYGEDTFTVPASLAGLPAVSVPFGGTLVTLKEGSKHLAPCSVQLIGRPHDEAVILGLAGQLEQVAWNSC